MGAAAAGVTLAAPGNPGSCDVSFLGAIPGASMRTVSRLTLGATLGFGGSVMRTVSFFGMFEVGVEGVSSAIAGVSSYLNVTIVVKSPFIQRSLIGVNTRPGSGPLYSLNGRKRRLSASCSSTWAVQPLMRAIAKIGVNKSVGMPSE